MHTLITHTHTHTQSSHTHDVHTYTADDHSSEDKDREDDDTETPARMTNGVRRRRELEEEACARRGWILHVMYTVSWITIHSFAG